MKRILDISLVLICIPCFLLPVVCICIIQKIQLGSPIFFHQKRLGMHGHPFFIHKFRTMRTGEGSDAQRLTPWGRFLRSTSLDELPELWNVWRGEMSFVGPRPLPTHYKERYTKEQNRRHSVPPGITGWAQINGRNTLSWDEQFRLDCWYVDNHSIMLDLKILFLTIREVLLRKNINEKDQATRSEFLGNEHPKQQSYSPQTSISDHEHR
ncbi:MAG: sugar transferase [Puniceicoccaceae bacterium]|nr:sugar transferase [Puniceicoccaceae bacterium]